MSCRFTGWAEIERGFNIDMIARLKAKGIAPLPAGRMQCLLSRALVMLGVLAMMAASSQWAHAQSDGQTQFKSIPTQFIAALGDPGDSSGTGAEAWGLWREDPGPRGVWLSKYDTLKAAGGIAPAKWQFDAEDWWVEEHGLIMEKPEFPLPPGKYVVTGGRAAMSVLTVFAADKDGAQRWELDDDVKLFDVTHLPCRSARYSPLSSDMACSPAKARMASFPVSPGASMPPIDGCRKQDYAVLFVVAVAVRN